MRYEGPVIEGPKQGIERRRIGGACAQDDHTQTLQIRLLDEPASESEALFRRRTVQYVEIHPVGHVERRSPRSGAIHQEIDQQGYRSAGAAFLRAAEPRGTGDVEMGPR